MGRVDPLAGTGTAAGAKRLLDRRIFYATAGVRALATGLAGVLLGLYLAEARLSRAQIGIVVAIGLAGSATGSLLATVLADRAGRRRLLVALSAFAAAGGAWFALADAFAPLAAAAFAGMVNGMGRDRSGWLIIEQAVLPDTGTDRERTAVFARYNVVQDAGHALGSALAALPAMLTAQFGVAALSSYRWTFGLYAALLAATVLLYLGLSPAVEAPRRAAAVTLSPPSARLLAKICALFAIDSLGGGFMTTALLSLFFHERFGADAGTIGALFFASRVANAVSHLGAAWLAKRIGLVKTMVFTHIPSSLLLCTVPFAPNFPVAAILFVVREGLVEMDVPTRQSYVMAVTRPEERTLASGATNLVRVGAWAVGPAFAGYFMQAVSAATPLFIGAAIKIAYDAMLYLTLRNLRPPEEGGAGPGQGARNLPP